MASAREPTSDDVVTKSERPRPVPGPRFRWRVELGYLVLAAVGVMAGQYYVVVGRGGDVIAALLLLAVAGIFGAKVFGDAIRSGSVPPDLGSRVSERERLQQELTALNEKVEDQKREADRLDKIIESYRSQASTEFREAATDLLGEESAATVAAHFNGWSRDLMERHVRVRRWAVLSLLTGSLLVGGLLVYGAQHGFDTQLLLAKISISVPFGVLFATLYVESNQYRHEALVAENVSVQMRSVASYTIWLDQESKDAVRRKLGEAIFTGPPAHLLGSKGAEQEAVPTDIVLSLLTTLLAPVSGREAKAKG